MLKRTRNELLLVAAAVLLAFVAGKLLFQERASQVGPPDRSSVHVTSNVVPGDHCPELTSWVASPLRTSVGGWIDVGAAARDVDPGQILTLSWKPEDHFEQPHLRTTRYACKERGAQRITLEISDSVSPVPCVTQLSFRVECVTP